MSLDIQRKTLVTAAAAALMLIEGIALGGQKPDFSGVWVPERVAQEAQPSGPRGGAMMGPITVTQTAERLTVVRVVDSNEVTEIHRLDGAETISQAGRGGTSRSVAKWDGKRLVITITQRAPDGADRMAKQTWSLEGSLLRIATERLNRLGILVENVMSYKKSDQNKGDL